MKHATKVAAALAAALVAPLAQAVPVTVDFSVTSTDSSTGSYAAGVVGTGYFTFDDSLIPASGTGTIGNSILGVQTLDLSFNWFGTSFDTTNAGIATLSFLDGVLTDWWIGGTYAAPICGLGRYSCVHSAGTEADFILRTEGGSINDGINAGIGAGYGTVTWSVRSASVPEPMTLGLFGLGLAAIGLGRRRRQV